MSTRLAGPAGIESDPAPGRSPLRALLVLLPFGTALVAAGFGGVTGPEGLRYLAWTLGWWVVGTALFRLLPWLPASRFAAWTYGGVGGIIVQLVAWALTVAFDRGSWLPVVLGASLLLVLALPRTRRGLLDLLRPSSEATPEATPDAGSGASALTEEAEPFERHLGRISTSALAAWSAGATLLCVAAISFFRTETLPPGPSSMYQDLYWHLGIVAELKHHLPPDVMESRTGALNYHWLSDAFMAAGSLGAHVPTLIAAERLWVLPVVLLSPALLVVVGRQISRSWRAAWPAIAVTSTGTTLPILPWQGLGPSNTYAFLSPSQLFGIPMTLLAVSFMVAALRARRLSLPAAVFMVALGFVCAGSKSSILPVLVGGTTLLCLTLLRHRTPERRQTLSVAWRLLVCELLALAAAVPLFAGGSAGSKMRLLGHLRHWSIVSRVTHHQYQYDHGPFVPPGLTTSAVLVLAALVVAILLSYGVGALALLIGPRRWRTDPAPVLLSGIFLASVAALLVIDHTGQSESYFPMGAMPLLAVLAGWGWVAARGFAPRHPVALTALGSLAGLGLAIAISRLAPVPMIAPGHHVHLALWLGIPLVLWALVVALFALAFRRRSAALLPAATVLLALGITMPGWNTAKDIGHGLSTTAQTSAVTVLPAESATAAWVRAHTPTTALVATNVHCMPVRRRPHCMSSAYWTSGLMERHLYVGSWGYTDAAQRNAGKDGQAAINQDYPDQAAYQLNEAMFYAPTAGTAARLRQLGVSYLYADDRAAPVSPAISRYAHLLDRRGPVAVYRLP